MWNSATFASNVNFPASVAVLAFLAASGGLFLSAVGVGIFYFVRKPKLALLLMKCTAAGAAVYFILLSGFSLASRDTMLSRGQEKYFCEIDCHLAYSVLETKTAAESNAMKYTVTLRTRFDENTISPQRPRDYPLTPAPRTIFLLDEQGRVYSPQAVAGTPLMTGLIPGQSYTTDLNFDLPAGVKADALLVSTSIAWPDHVVIGDENSWLHKKTYLRL
jgi:hypothetical protein